MKDERKTKQQLVAELLELRQQLAELEASEAKRVRAEEALRESEEHYRTLFERVPVGLYRTRPDGQIIDANAALVEMLGFPDQETALMVNAIEGYANPEDRSRWQTLMEREGVVRGFEAQWRRRDGTVIWGKESTRVVRDDKGQVLYYEGTLEDITERKRAEEALRKSEERFRRLSEAAFEAIAIHEGGVVLSANDQYFEMFGYEPDELLGKQVVPLTVAPEADEFLRKQIATGGLGPYESIGLRKDGTKFPMEIRVREMEYEGRKVRVGAIMDITERKRAEAALRESEARFRVALENSPIVVFNQDQELRYTWVYNPHPGFDPQATLGKTDAELLPAEDAARLTEIKRRVLETGITAREEVRITINGQTFFYDLTVEPLRDASGNIAGVTCASMDITKRKRAEEALRESEERLRVLFNNTHDLISLTDETVTTLWANPAWLEVLGPELESRPDPFTLLHPADVEKVSEAWRALISQGAELQNLEYRFKLPSGEYGTFESSAHPVMLGGQRRYYVIAHNITERKRAEDLIRTQHDLGLALSTAQGLDETLRLCLEAAIQVSGMDCGGIYLVDETSGAVDIVSHQGLPPGFIESASHFDGDSANARLVIAGEPIYTEHLALGAELSEAERRESLRALAIVPVRYQNRVIACLNVASHIRGEVSNHARDAIEATATQIGSVIARAQAQEALRRSLEETARGQRLLLALSQAAQAVQRAHTPDEVYRTVGDEVVGLGYHVAIFTLTADRAHLVLSYLTVESTLVRAAEKLTGLSARDYRIPLVPGSFYQRAIAGGKTVFAESGSGPTAEALPKRVRALAGRVAAVLGTDRAISAPLTVGGEPYGLLAVMGTDLTEADVQFVTVFANQAAIALENARLLETVTQHGRDLQRLSAQIISAQEAERQRISQELHDEMGQALTAMSINLAVIEKELPPELAPVVRERLAETNSLAGQTLEQVRELALDLRPAMLDDLGLVPAVRWYANRFAKRLDLEVELEAIDLDERLSPEVETALYRVVQEALTNIARHAQASRVRLRLERKPSTVVAVIEDDGIGFDVAGPAGQVPERGGGLIGVQERVAFLGGSLSIQSRPGQGTRLSIKVPLRRGGGS